MAFNHNLLGVIVEPNHESLVQHKIWKGAPNLSGQHFATVRGVERDKGATIFLCADPNGALFNVSAEIVRVIKEKN